MPTLLEKLAARGRIQDCTQSEALDKAFESEPLCFYCGFDPTADSLHVGSMLPLIIMRALQKAGHKPLVLLGSGTGMIGDPSGKSEERKLLDDEALAKNLEGMRKQFSLFLSDKGDNAFEIVSNIDWLGKISLIEFLRDIGKHFSVNAMMAKDSVKTRLENREQGISYTEFSYMLLQAYDFLWLYQHKNCRLQVGGSDQWGNITAGAELIRRKIGAEATSAFGLTFPLLTTSAGTKFGKTEKGAVWLDPKKTSPYEFYQYWLNAGDLDVISYLKLFTEISAEELQELELQVQKNPAERAAQKRLASILCDLTHGEQETRKAEQASQILFGQKIENIDSETLLSIFNEVPSTEISPAQLDAGILLADLMVLAGAAKSKGAAKRLIEGGGLYLNNEKISDSSLALSKDDLVDNRVAVLRSGKKNYYLIVLKSA